MNKKVTIAVDFDGTLFQYEFPEIGEQTFLQKKLMETLIELRLNGNKLILWTNRGDNEKYKVLTEAIEWCKNKGLEFDAINENLPNQKKISGYSPKIMADYYIDDKALTFNNLKTQEETLEKLNNLKLE